MIPFFQLTGISFGPITIHIWGLMVSLGILAGRLVRAGDPKSLVDQDLGDAAHANTANAYKVKFLDR
jgi:prolipoprotein diacylglyceryltransferase